MNDQQKLHTTYADLLDDTSDPALTYLVQNMDTLAHGPQPPSSLNWSTISNLHKTQTDEAHVRTSADYLVSSPRSGWIRRRTRFGVGLAAAVLLLSILAGSLLFSTHLDLFQTLQKPSMHITLVTSQSGSAPTQEALEQARTILLNRFNYFGLTDSKVTIVNTSGQTRLLVDTVQFGNNDQEVFSTLLETGTIQAWDTGPAGILQPGVTFHADNYAQYNPGGKPGFANQDFNPQAFSAIQDKQSGAYNVSFAMQGSATQRFQQYTAAHIGDVLTITLDDKVITSGVIQSTITGPGVIAGNFTQQQAKALVATLTSGALPIHLKAV
ncbi:SecDF P1 head subdomain-containing protein [Dictyobacter kobayashii]|uniref:SecDF P1 head subdomain domain-containing protein n=1 Tax=Dictyobacter kobayashii TaxID=2014872 RepID=A0A402AT66_9CHLR|nr:hypothetical protein [Dictyobacter kobayashii]GCE22284.1 hypothetical protein KDK_60840 [Dictyobacter kobayashii]